MGKETTTITLDAAIKQIAKDKGLNISQITEDAIKDKSGLVEVDTEVLACEYCGKEMEKAIAETHNKGLVWLSPDERWWCQQCHPK